MSWGNWFPLLRPVGDPGQLILVSSDAGAEIKRE